jgi:hypothetical protein
MSGIKRIFNKPVSKKSPLTPPLFRSILDHLLYLGEGEASFLNQRLAVLLSLQYLSMARWEEVSNLLFDDITYTERGNLSICYRKAKNNQFGAARMATISAVPGSKYDPVTIFTSYKSKFEELSGGRELARVFTACQSRVVTSGTGVRARMPVPINAPWSYDAALQNFKSVLGQLDLDLDPSTFGMHSQRVGAASATFNSGEMSETQLQMSGRWVSELTPRTYIVPDEDCLMKASKILLSAMLG